MGYLVKIPRTYFPWDFDLREKLFSNGKSPDEIVIYLNCDTVSPGRGRYKKERFDFHLGARFRSPIKLPAKE
jgi:hypothetical protein